MQGMAAKTAEESLLAGISHFSLVSKREEGSMDPQLHTHERILPFVCVTASSSWFSGCLVGHVKSFP